MDGERGEGGMREGGWEMLSCLYVYRHGIYMVVPNKLVLNQINY